jgi:hypothetical protein
VAAIGLGFLYADALTTGFLNDDYLFLEEARTHSLSSSLIRLGALANYYRPLSRQIYFAALTPLAGHAPLVFHLVNAALFAAAIVLLMDLLLVFLPPAGAAAGALYFAVLPLQRVILTWISCSQDLMALVFCLAAFALFRRGRDRGAALAYLAALASKEVAFPLPLVLAVWALRDGDRPTWRAVAKRMAPFAALAMVWLAVIVYVRVTDQSVAAPLEWKEADFLAAWVHGVQSLLGLEHPAGIVAALSEHPPALVPLVALAALALILWPRRAAPDVVPAAAYGARVTLGFAALWTLVFALPVGPVVKTWSSYYYVVAAVGGALAVGWLCRSIDRLGWLLLVAATLWWHAGGSGTRAFAVTDKPWGWTSHLTNFYFRRGAALTDTMRRALRRIEPSPPHGTRFFMATLPPWAGFQGGNGPLIRDLYRDTSLASYFYSQFDYATAGDRPCRFLYWDGVRFEPLYGARSEPWFQVGSDLLLLDRPAGAAHAFRRGLAAGEVPQDHLYWLGWAELWRGQRDEAERLWTRFGARDDPEAYHVHMDEAHLALNAGDTLLARRRLFAAIAAGIGRPEAHGALGELLLRQQLKYALLELKTAAFLNPNDLRARRELVVGLTTVRMDEAARRELKGLLELEPAWTRDSALTAARATLDGRSTASTVVEF